MNYWIICLRENTLIKILKLSNTLVFRVTVDSKMWVEIKQGANLEIERRSSYRAIVVFDSELSLRLGIIKYAC